MKSKNPLFAFFTPRGTIAVIQAMNKKQARERANLISHITKIPSTCRVSVVERGTVIRAPVFFEGHFLAIEDVLAAV